MIQFLVRSARRYGNSDCGHSFERTLPLPRFYAQLVSRPLTASLAICWIALVLAPAQLCSATDERDTELGSFLNRHCVRCHGGDTQEGEVRLDVFPSDAGSNGDAEHWESVLEVLETGYMPPEDEPAVKDIERQKMIAGVKQFLREGLAQDTTVPKTPMRRMNRFQYNNAVVDLLELKLDLFALPERMMREHGVYFDPNSKTMPATVRVGSRPLGKSQLVQPRLAGVGPFPQDLRAEHGFDNRADHLSLSPLLMESFLKLGRSIVGSRDFGPRTCGVWNSIFEPPAKGTVWEDEVHRRLSWVLTRAFRRPVSDQTLNPYVLHVVSRIDQGDSFTDAMKLAVSAVLASPRFLYLYDLDLEAESESQVAYSLASRLSFFLWGSIPDQELIDEARTGRLRDAEILDEQITRMLNDRKLKRFCDSFPAQWLQLEQIISAKPDEEKFPTFYRGQYRVSMHMMAEPLLLFETLLVEDRSILELIDPPFSYRSDVLDGWLESGNAGNFRPTVLDFHRTNNADRREGGVITNPAVMTMTSSPERTKPITRGAWIASVIFNSPPQPPPADVPPLSDTIDAETEALTLRERLDQHRQRADCKGCHAKIDPFGFALENYGPTGVWREQYDNGRNVDASGVLFRKHPFSNPVEFKDAVLAEKTRFVRAFAKHLLSFSLGREVSVFDSPSLDRIVASTVDDDYRMRTMIRLVASSDAFVQDARAAQPSSP